MDRSSVSIGAHRVLLTIGVEDYYQVGSFEGLIQRENWYRFETRIARNTQKALDLLDRFGVRATFFVLGCVADGMPEVVREIARRGHEIASGGYRHRTIRQMTPAEFRDDLRRSRDALERAAGVRILGIALLGDDVGPVQTAVCAACGRVYTVREGEVREG